MTQFLNLYLWDILCILSVIVFLIILLLCGKKEVVRNLSYRIIMQANIRYDAAPDDRFRLIYELLPRPVRILYSLKDIRTIIDELFDELIELTESTVSSPNATKLQGKKKE